MKFEVGDRIRCTELCAYINPTGVEGVVTDVDPVLPYPYTVRVNHPSGGSWILKEYELEAAE